MIVWQGNAPLNERLAPALSPTLFALGWATAMAVAVYFFGEWFPSPRSPDPIIMWGISMLYLSGIPAWRLWRWERGAALTLALVGAGSLIATIAFHDAIARIVTTVFPIVLIYPDR